jgi:hypothetical protein
MSEKLVMRRSSVRFRQAAQYLTRPFPILREGPGLPPLQLSLQLALPCVACDWVRSSSTWASVLHEPR